MRTLIWLDQSSFELSESFDYGVIDMNTDRGSGELQDEDGHSDMRGLDTAVRRIRPGRAAVYERASTTEVAGRHGYVADSPGLSAVAVSRRSVFS